MEILSEALGFNQNISIEFSTCDYHDKYFNDVSNESNLKMLFHPYFQYEPAYNSATTCEHMKKFIQWMYGDFFHKVWYYT